MDTLQKLVEIHKPVGLYDIKEGSNIYRELSVYALALDEIQSALQKAEQEGFLLTAEEEGLAEIERVFGAVRDDLEKEKRREMILSRYSLGGRVFTPEVLPKIMDTLGVKGEFSQYPAQYRITVHIEGEHPLAMRRWIASQLKELLPAHLETDPVFEGFSFKEIDERAMSFKEMEQRGMCWADIDIYCKD